MPPRWLLPKARVSHEEIREAIVQPSKTETIQTPRWGDFYFNDENLPSVKGAQLDERPKTSSGVSGRDRSKSRTRPQPGHTLERPKTSEGRPPSTINACYSPSKLNGDMIGVAFGSPTHAPPTFFGTLNGLAPPSTYEESIFEQREPMYQIRGRTSKWKKFGALFKGAKTLSDKDEIFEVPFYKVRVAEESKEPDVKEPLKRHDTEAAEQPTRRSPTPPPKENRRRSIDERLAQARLEVARLEEAIAEAERKAIEQTDASRPKLDLVIPDISLDRYSVMFKDLKEIPPHSKLLARRSKKLDPLKSVSPEELKKIDDLDTPDTSTLSPRLNLSRRATSPSATKPTAGFSLFPTTSLTPNHAARQALGTLSPRGQLRRSITSPARLSPRAGTFTEKPRPNQLPRSRSDSKVVSPGDTTASTDQEAPWSAEAFLSPTTTITTIDEDILLTPAKDGRQIEPQEQYPDANEVQHSQFLASPTLPQGLGETPDATTPVITIDPSQDDDYKVQRIASSVFDAAIADIEAFGIHSFQDQAPLPSPPSAYVPFLLARDEEPGSSVDSKKSVAGISKSRLMMMNMPSPITEAPEESPAPSPSKAKLAAEGTMEHSVSEPKSSPPAARTNLIMPLIDTKNNVSASNFVTSTAPASNSVNAASEVFLESSLQNAPRSNSRQRTSDKVEKVLGETPPAPPFQMSVTTVFTPEKSKKAVNTSMTNRSKAVTRERELSGTSSSPIEVPPAVPTKDSKFVLPLSRYAVKGTAAEVAQKSGLKATPKSTVLPTYPKRSVTEPLTTFHMNKSYPKSKPSRLARSASDESLQREVTNPKAMGIVTSHLERMGLERPSVMTVTAVIKPAPVPRGGEVGVARTVSLSRKPSQRILVKRNDSRMESNSQEGGLQQDRAHKVDEQAERGRMMAMRPPRSSSRQQGPMANLKRSESFKRAIDVGLDDAEEGDMRGGELRARAISPEMKRVMTGLVVNGHKVMKSSVGIIEEA